MKFASEHIKHYCRGITFIAVLKVKLTTASAILSGNYTLCEKLQSLMESHSYTPYCLIVLFWHCIIDNGTIFTWPTVLDKIQLMLGALLLVAQNKPYCGLLKELIGTPLLWDFSRRRDWRKSNLYCVQHSVCQLLKKIWDRLEDTWEAPMFSKTKVRWRWCALTSYQYLFVATEFFQGKSGLQQDFILFMESYLPGTGLRDQPMFWTQSTDLDFHLCPKLLPQVFPSQKVWLEQIGWWYFEMQNAC